MHRNSHSNKTGWILALGALASVMVALDALVVSTALSVIRLDLDASLEQLEWTVNAYNLALAVSLITAAALGDRFGRRRMFITGLLIFVGASAVCAVSSNVGALIAARAVQGVGAAFVLTLSLTLVSAAFPTERRGAAIGILEGLTGLAVALGPLVGGGIADGLDWRWIFAINVPIGILAVVCSRLMLTESHGPDRHLDLPGLAFVTTASFGLVWALVRGNAIGWSSAEVLVTALGGVTFACVFVMWERRAAHPMLPIAFFRNRAFSSGNGAALATVAALYGAVFFFAQFLQTGLGYGAFETGVRLLPWTGTLLVVAPIAGALVNRFGERVFMTGGLLLQATGMIWIATIADTDVSYSSLVLPLIVAGAGVSMAIPAAQTSVIGSVEQAAIGKAAGANTMARELGGVFGIALAVAAFAAAGSYVSPSAFVDGFGPAITVTAGLSLLGAFIGLGLPGRSKRVIDDALAARAA